MPGEKYVKEDKNKLKMSEKSNIIENKENKIKSDLKILLL